MYKLNLGDSLEYIKGLDDNSLNHIITDPPYNISKDNNFKTMGRAGIDFGEWDKCFDLTKWIDLVSNKIKKGGNIVIFNDWKNLSYICEALENNGFEVKDMIRWENQTLCLEIEIDASLLIMKQLYGRLRKVLSGHSIDLMILMIDL